MTTGGDTPGSAGGPTVLRMLLGAHLRRLREAQGVSREDAGWEIRASESKISRMELGRVSFKERDVADLLTLYGVDDDDERDAAARAWPGEANNPGWWHRYGDVLPGWFQSYLGPRGGRDADPHVRGAVRARAAADRGLRAGGHPARPRPGQRRRDRAPGRAADAPPAGARPAGRRRSCGRSSTRRCCAGRSAAVDVMRGQIEALIEATAAPNVRLQIIPFQAGGHAGRRRRVHASCASPSQDLPDVVYVEQLTSALYLDKRDDVDLYATRWSGSASRPTRRSARRTRCAGILKDT